MEIFSVYFCETYWYISIKSSCLFLFLESRPLSVPVKAVLTITEGCRSPEERMKEFIGVVWNAVKSLTLQVK